MKEKELFRVIQKTYDKEKNIFKLKKTEVVMSTTNFKEAEKKANNLRKQNDGRQANKRLYTLQIEIFDNTICNWRLLSYGDWERLSNV